MGVPESPAAEAKTRLPARAGTSLPAAGDVGQSTKASTREAAPFLPERAGKYVPLVDVLAALARLQASRQFALKCQVRLNNATLHLVAGQLGYRNAMAPAERKALFDRAARIVTALANLACAIALRFGPGETAALFRDLASLCERPPGGPPPPGRMQ